MVDAEEFERWRLEADAALIGARSQARDGLYNWACFSCEQAAQLAIKALLHGWGRGPWGHDLDELIRSVAAGGIEVARSVQEAGARLGRHYVAARYPDAHVAGAPRSHYTVADWEQSLQDAELILRAVDEWWRTLNV